MRIQCALYLLFPLAALSQETVPPALTPIFRLWSQAAYYGQPEKCCGDFNYKPGREVRVVAASNARYVGMCSAELGAWQVFEGRAGLPLRPAGGGTLLPEESDVESCRARIAPVAQEMEFTPLSVVLPELAGYFRALPYPRESFAHRVRTSVNSELKSGSPGCPSIVSLGKWAAEAGVAFGRSFSWKQGCADRLISFEPYRVPPNTRLLLGLPKDEADRLETSIRRADVLIQGAQPGGRRTILDKMTIASTCAAMLTGGVYLLKTSQVRTSQGVGVRAGRLAGGIALTGLGSFFVCVAFGHCTQ